MEGVDYGGVRNLVEAAGQAGVRSGQGDNWRPLLRSTLSRGGLAEVLIAALGNPDAVKQDLRGSERSGPAARRRAFAELVRDPD